MNTPQTRELANGIVHTLKTDGVEAAYNRLAPTLAERTPFRLLDIIGERIGAEPNPLLNDYLDRIAQDKLEGGWVVIASALRQTYAVGPQATIDRCRAYIIAADVWYGADIFSERVPGPALVDDFSNALKLLATWRSDPDRWVRRSVGVAAHFWAKRSRGVPELVYRAEALLHFLGPMFTEWEMDATKGVAWGLKTLGRYYPEQVTDWLVNEVLPSAPRYRAHMLRKATLYLSEEQREAIFGVDERHRG